MKLCSLLFALSVLVASAAQANPPPDRRAVTVGGQGEIAVHPDRARLSLAVDRFANEPQPAEAEVNKVVRAYLAELKRLGVEDRHISTAGISLQPEYVWDESLRQNRISGYRARRDIQVLVMKLDRVGDLVLAATRSGVNHVMPPTLESSRDKELGREALAAAAEDARLRADLLARTLGARLGAVRSIVAVDGGFQPSPLPKVMMMRSDADGLAGNEQMGFRTGEIRVTATVQAEFDLIVP
jgi:uncharacterized protein